MEMHKAVYFDAHALFWLPYGLSTSDCPVFKTSGCGTGVSTPGWSLFSAGRF